MALQWRQSHRTEGLLVGAVLQELHNDLVTVEVNQLLRDEFVAKLGLQHFGIGVGTIVMFANVVLLSGYTIGCHSMRHVVGGVLDRLSKAPIRKLAYDCSSACNRGHMKWAWCSLFSVALTDVYIRLCASGVLTDVRIF